MIGPEPTEPTPSSIEAAVDALRSGELIAFPTDTYFALGADGLNPEAIDRVFQAKGRMQGNPLPLLIDSIEQLTQLVTRIPDGAADLAERFWPGQLTIVLPASDAVPSSITAGGGTVGLRVPDHPIPRRLARLLGGPITGTSANHSGEPPSVDSHKVAANLGWKVKMVIEGQCGGRTAPSTVIDCTVSPFRIVRDGAVTIETLRRTVPDISQP